MILSYQENIRQTFGIISNISAEIPELKFEQYDLLRCKGQFSTLENILKAVAVL
jgi:hypothetical protein